MTAEPNQPSGGDKRPRGILRPAVKPIVAAVLGALLGALCANLPPNYQAPCDLVSRILPGACGVQGSDQ